MALKRTTMLAVMVAVDWQDWGRMNVVRRQIVRTPYGDPSGPLVVGEIGGALCSLPRHGPGHVLAPHRVNYRANIWALRECWRHRYCRRCCRGDRCKRRSGVIAVPDQIIDYTYGREHTYCDGSDRQVTHVDFTRPYSDELRDQVLSAAEGASVAVVAGGVYGATQGPRLETAAEIVRMQRRRHIGGHDRHAGGGVGARVVFALCTLCAASNWAAGCGDSTRAISHANIDATLDLAIGRVQEIVAHLAMAYHKRTAN